MMFFGHKKQVLASVATLLGVALSSGVANAYVVSYSVAELDAMVVDETVDLVNNSEAALIRGNNLDVATGVGASTGGGTGWYWPNDKTRRQAASAADNRWIQTGNSEVWDLGGGFKDVVVSNGYDHGRFDSNPAEVYEEALEWTVWGSNDADAFFGGQNNSGSWELGHLSKIFSQGWDANETYDDYTGMVSFSQDYRYVHVIADHSISIGGKTSFDNEIDFVAGISADVPEPASLALLSLGLGLVGMRLKRS